MVRIFTGIPQTAGFNPGCCARTSWEKNNKSNKKNKIKGKKPFQVGTMRFVLLVLPPSSDSSHSPAMPQFIGMWLKRRMSHEAPVCLLQFINDTELVAGEVLSL